MIDSLLPSGVAVSETFIDLDAVLFPAEAAMIEGAVERRRREFVTGRACARRALRQLGLPAGPLLRGEWGALRWPTGTVGSITHCQGYCACAVARSDVVSTLGIDGEPALPLPRDVREVVLLADEHRWLAKVERQSAAVPWDRVIFSAKESLYKAWSPVARRWLGFEDATIELDPAGTFKVHLLAAARPGEESIMQSLVGRWTVSPAIVATAVWGVTSNPVAQP